MARREAASRDRIIPSIGLMQRILRVSHGCGPVIRAARSAIHHFMPGVSRFRKPLRFYASAVMLLELAIFSLESGLARR